MAFGTGINVSAIKTQRQISVTTGRLNQSFERLSSGLRINRSADDAAGLRGGGSLGELLGGDAGHDAVDREHDRGDGELAGVVLAQRDLGAHR